MVTLHLSTAIHFSGYRVNQAVFQIFALALNARFSPAVVAAFVHDNQRRLSKLYSWKEKKSKTSWGAETVDYEKIAAGRRASHENRRPEPFPRSLRPCLRAVLPRLQPEAVP